MMQAQAALIPGGRLHLHHGPIDLIIGVDPEAQRTAAFSAAFTRFQTLLRELTDELPLLRAPLTANGPRPHGTVAKRMFRACEPHAAQGFVTPMAAVAGAVAEEVLAAMVQVATPERAYVNNGGDIALHLIPGAHYNTLMAGMDGVELGRITLESENGIKGVATSGQGGRSLSFGIAESVTVLAKTAAQADVTATLIANAVDLPDHPAIKRAPASERNPDSDLGNRLVVTNVGALDQQEVAAALARGHAKAREFLASGCIHAAHLCLRRQSSFLGELPLCAPSGKELADA